MTDEPEIAHEERDGRGRYALRHEGAEAELLYVRRTHDLVVAERTFVPPASRGHGLAGALTRRLAQDARAEGIRIVPRCSFVEAWRRRHPDWADVFET